MKRIPIEKPRIGRERDWRETLPLDPRDPDVGRAKALARARPHRYGDGDQVTIPVVADAVAKSRLQELRQDAELRRLAMRARSVTGPDLGGWCRRVVLHAAGLAGLPPAVVSTQAAGDGPPVSAQAPGTGGPRRAAVGAAIRPGLCVAAATGIHPDRVPGKVLRTDRRSTPATMAGHRDDLRRAAGTAC